MRNHRRKKPIDPVLAAKLDALIASHTSLSEAARAVGLSKGYLSHARRGYRQPGRKLLRVLGLTEKIIYR